MHLSSLFWLGFALVFHVVKATTESNANETCSVNTTLVQIDNDNWSQICSGEWMLAFTTTWCYYCKLLHPIWEEFAAESEQLGINVGHVDTDKNRFLSSYFNISGIPFVYHMKDRQIRECTTRRSLSSYRKFVQKKYWNRTKPVSAWKLCLASDMYEMAFQIQSGASRLKPFFFFSW